MMSKARKNAKPTVCALCGKNVTSFCNSHSVPRMALKTIADQGIVLHASAMSDFDKDIIDVENGINKSGTFNYICNDCDGSFFQDYENPNNIVCFPTDKMLAEIAVKNFLLQMNKRSVEMELFNIMQQKLHIFENLEYEIDIKKMDLSEFESEVKFHKSIADNDETGGYQILIWKVLQYVVPIAMQSAIALTKDMEGNEINNIYNMNNNVRMQYLHLAILPVNNVSVIIAFCHKRDSLYRRLRHQINSISENEVLKYVNYLMFEYTENYYISKKIENEISTNERLHRLAQESDGNPNFGMLGVNNIWGINYKPVDKDEIPNLLSCEWAI